MSKRKSSAGLDTISDIANLLGLGDLVDSIFSGGYDTGDQVATKLLQEIMNNENNINSLGNYKLNQLASKLNELSSIYNTGAFKNQIGSLKRRVADNYSKIGNLQSNIDRRIENQNSIAQEALGHSRTWAKKNEKHLREDISNLQNKNAQDISKIEQTII